MAVHLATHPDELARIRKKLADNRLGAPLFDTAGFTRHIEAAYTAMYERHRMGLGPGSIAIPPMPRPRLEADGEVRSFR